MQFSITTRSGTGFTGVTIRHRDREISWLVKFFTKVKLVDADEVFAAINGFLATLPMDAQDMMFEQYVEMKEIIDETMDGADMVIPLRDCIKRVYALFTMESLRHWMMMYYPIYVPEMASEVRATDRHTNRDETFIKGDYYDLVVFATAVRLMIPIWGEYITQGGNQGSAVYKESDALSLIQGNEVMHWPQEATSEGGLPVRDKLLRFIEIKASRKSMSLADLMAGISEPDLAPRLLATVILRRLTIAPIAVTSSMGEGKNLVINIHHYVDQNLSNTDKRSNAVTQKMNDKEGFDPEDKTSMAEQYRIRQKVSGGDVTAYEKIDARRPAFLASRVDPTIDPALVTTTLSALPSMENVIASKHQFTLAQWALAKAFPARAFDDVDLKSVNHLLVAAQALYWHWGLYDIALLLTVSPINLSSDDHPGISPLVKPTSRFKQDVQDEFMAMYPHYFPQSGKDAREIKGNVAYMGVTIVMQEMFEASWRYLGCQELLDQSNQDVHQRTIIVQTSIRQSLSEAVKKIVSLNQ